MAGQNAPTTAVPLEQARMGKVKMSLVSMDDGLPAAEISTAALRHDARNPKGFRKVNEFGQSIDGTPEVEEPEEAAPSIRTLVEGDPEPEQAIVAPKVGKAPPKPKKGAVRDPEPTPEPAIGIAGKVVFRANYMEMKIPVITMVKSGPMLMILTPVDADNRFEPPTKAEGVQIKLPKDLGAEIPFGWPIDEWVDLYVTGIYADIPLFGVRTAIFYAQLNEE